MLFRMIYDDKLAQAAYLIGCQRSGEAIVVDPERDVDRYIGAAAKEGLKVVAVAETHIHADFLSGARELAERTGARVYVSGEGGAEWRYGWLEQKPGGGSYDHVELHDGDVLRVGNIELRAIHTPGHTPEHLCYAVVDRGGGASEPMGVLTGDFVFVGDLGRPDLLESAVGKSGEAESSARRLFQTLRTLDSLAEWVQIWPAHGAGSACGKALGAVPQSTLGYERRTNAALRAASSEGAFVRFILEGQPEPPLYFARMKRLNKEGPRVLGGLPTPKEMGQAELGGLDARRVALIDTREWAAFRAAHVPGAMFHPINNAFPTDVGSMVREGEAIYLVVEPAKLEEAVRCLFRVGLDDVRGFFPPAAVEGFVRAGGASASTGEVSAADARSMIGERGHFVLDVRRASEFAAGHIPGAMNIVHTRLLSRLDELPTDRKVLVNCRSGQRSARACALLQKNGFDATNLAGGMIAWDEAMR